MSRPQLLAIEVRDHGLAHAVVEGVERRSAAHAPQQVLRTEQGGSLASLAGAELGRLDGNVLGDDSAGDGDGAKQGDRMLGEPRDSLVQRVVEPERHAVEPTARLQEAHELIDEVRAPLRFLGDAPHASAVGLQRVQKEDSPRDPRRRPD